MTSALVVAETALSLVLLIGAGLLIRTFVELRNVEPGFRADNVLTLELALRGTRYDETAELDAFVTRAFERIEALSGVEAAASVTRLPMEGGMWIPFEIDARPEGAHDRNGEGLWRAITPRYFDVMEIPLSRGRPFDRRDGVLAPPVAIINEALARKFWPDREPIGERITVGRLMGPAFEDRSREIVGIVGNTREESLVSEPMEMVFLPAAQVPSAVNTLVNEMYPAN